MKLTIHTLIALPAVLLMSALPFSHKGGPTASAPAPSGGWITLFDGTSTKGWHDYGKTTAGPEWEIQDGTLHLNPTKGGIDLVSDEEYGNFDLKIEWKVAPKSNSGIIFYVHEDPAKYPEPYHTGLEMQVLDNEGHPDGKFYKHRAGDLYDLIACSKETVLPVGQWNKAEIYCKDGHLKLYLNGTNVVSTTLWDDNWRTMVAGSKFRQWADFGTYKTGHIDLQDHGNEVWFRNIMIKKL